jgi:uncharacterized protein (TIGR04222 family)
MKIFSSGLKAGHNIFGNLSKILNRLSGFSSKFTSKRFVIFKRRIRSGRQGLEFFQGGYFMNPFYLRGPEFLLFYAILCAIVIVTLVLLRRTGEAGKTPKTNLSDPYLIAYLRGGKNETLRIALLSLIDRNLLTVKDQTVQTAANVTPGMVSLPLEQAILKIFAKADAATSIYSSPTLESACSVYETRLQQNGLLPDEETKAIRRKRLRFVAMILLGVGFARIFQSLATGHYNLLYLLGMMIVAILIARAYYSPRVTQSGKEFLEDVQTLYAHIRYAKLNPQQGSVSTDTMMLAAAVFGISAITDYSTFAYAHTLFPKATQNPGQTSSSCGTSCGSSCSSSGSSSCSSSSCGSSCGGGGCGGGGCSS